MILVENELIQRNELVSFVSLEPLSSYFFNSNNSNCLHGQGNDGKKITSLFQTHEVHRIVYFLEKLPFQASWALIDGMYRVLIVNRRSWKVQSMAHSTGQRLLGITRDILHEVCDLY